MSKSRSAIFIAKNNFDDLDEFLDTIQGWNLNWTQLEGGKFRGELLQLGIDNFLLSHGKFNLPFRQQDGVPGDLWTFAILTDASSPARWRNREIFSDTIMVLPPNSEGDVVSRPGYDVYTLSFTEKALSETAQSAGFHDLQTLVGGSRTLICDRQKMRELQSETFQIVKELVKTSSIRGYSRLDHFIKFKISRRLLSALASSRSATPSSHMTLLRDRAVQQAVAYIDENAEEPIYLRDLSSITGASERTLRYGFLERFGVSPKSYLQAHRLNGSRRELRRADPATLKVADIANRWGFWHMGKFAADYRKLCGELPSETLRRQYYPPNVPPRM
jgi:AraC family ethanolamine operon transcriptional activator